MEGALWSIAIALFFIMLTICQIRDNLKVTLINISDGLERLADFFEGQE